MKSKEGKDQKNKPKIKIELDWIFGIRKDMYPNIYYFNDYTFIYPAGHYIVIYNYDGMLGPNNRQHFIKGTPHSQGFTSIATLFIKDVSSVVAVSEEFPEYSDIKFYSITSGGGLKNLAKESSVSIDIKSSGIKTVYAMTFSQREGKDNFFIAFGASNGAVSSSNAGSPSRQQETKAVKYYLVVLKWDSGKDPTILQVTDLPKVHKKEEKYSISFTNQCSIKDPNELEFSIVCEDYIAFYTLQGDISIIQNYIYIMENDARIMSHCWLSDGSFAYLDSDTIVISKSTNRDLTEREIVQTFENNKEYTIIYSYLNNKYEGFIAAGKNGALDFYLKKTESGMNPNIEEPASDEDLDGNNDDIIQNEDNKFNKNNYILKFEKNNYDFVTGINEPISSEKHTDSKYSTQNDNIFDFHSLIVNSNSTEIYATTNNNDLIKIKIEFKNIPITRVEYCISPFHAEEITGLDCCINKPYLISCSKDKSVKVWDFLNRVQVLSKTFDENLYSITYHPSGMHALLSADSKIHHLVIHYDSIIINKGQSINIKQNSYDIKFSNLGHLFAFDSGTSVSIYDFLNMQVYSVPPNTSYQTHIKNYSSTYTNCLCSLSWGKLDKNLYVGAQNIFCNWKLRSESTSSARHNNKLCLSVLYSDESNKYFVTTDDNYIHRYDRILEEDDEDKSEKENQDPRKSIKHRLFDESMKELCLLETKPIMFCSTIINTKKNQRNQLNIEHNKRNLNKSNTSCIRMFPHYLENFEYIDIPSHYGETTRLRINNEKTKLFTCGEDGCINIYSIIYTTEMDFSRGFDTEPKYRETVLIDGQAKKTRDSTIKDLPSKKDEFLKKLKTENADTKESNARDLELTKNIKKTEKEEQERIFNEKSEEFERTKLEGLAHISSLKEEKDMEFEDKKNEAQRILADKTKEVDDLRELQRNTNDQRQKEMSEKAESNKKDLDKIILENERQKAECEKANNEILGEIEKLNFDEQADKQALEQINEQILAKINENVNELQQKIQELQNHYSHDLKKKREEKIQLEQKGSNLQIIIKKIQEDVDKQKKKKIQAELEKKEIVDLSKNYQAKISDIEQKIIECKKSHTYLEKCKFVLSYKITELKKEAGPMEKVLEDLQKRTKEDELSLQKYNREFEIIEAKVVDTAKLTKKARELNKTEKELIKKKEEFKLALENMGSHLNEPFLLNDDFYNLSEKFLYGYSPEIQDRDLEGEFSNQKSKMKSRVLELQDELIEQKKKHKMNIQQNREENKEMIGDISKLKKQIKEEKKRNENFIADLKHANAVAEIKASDFVKQKMMKDIPIKHKIKLITETIEIKKKELEELVQKMKENAEDKEGEQMIFDIPYEDDI